MDKRYYISRFVKIGEIEGEEVLNAISEPEVIRRGKYNFTFIDYNYIENVLENDFVFARMAKFSPEDEIEHVDLDSNTSTAERESNVLHAVSPFIYVPRLDGIAYQHIWNKLERNQFNLAFEDLILEKYDGLMYDVSVKAVTNMKTFVERVSTLSRIIEMNATVNPPNPWFGPAWESLRDYMASRDVDSMRVEEKNTGDGSINTNIPQIAGIINNNDQINEDRLEDLLEPYDTGISDAAILMAADGYGDAKILGFRNQDQVVVKTSENQVSFNYDDDPDPIELAREAISILEDIEENRHLEDGE